MKRTAIFCCLILLASTAYAQTTATSAAPPPEPSKPEPIFEKVASPMILTVLLPEASRVFSNQEIVMEDMGRFQCDGVSVTSVLVRGKRYKSASGFLKVGITTLTAKGSDRYVCPLVELLSDGDKIASAEMWQIDAEEESAAKGWVTVNVPDGKLGGDPKLSLRLTLRVEATWPVGPSVPCRRIPASPS